MMKQTIQKFVLFGATGDLAQRMIWPSLYHLCREKLVPPTLTFVGSARQPPCGHGLPHLRRSLAAQARARANTSSRPHSPTCSRASRYAPFEAGDGSAKGTDALQKTLAGNDRILYFMATSPKLFGPTCLSLAAAGLAGPALPRHPGEAHRHGLRVERSHQ